jgi:hypothetical protein
MITRLPRRRHSRLVLGLNYEPQKRMKYYGRLFGEERRKRTRYWDTGKTGMDWEKIEQERDDAQSDLARYVEGLQKVEAERDAARAALLLAARWGISSDGYSATVASDIRCWIINGMRGDAPKAPDYYPEKLQAKRAVDPLRRGF